MHALSILNGRVPGSAIPLLYNILCYSGLLCSALTRLPLCSTCPPDKAVTTTSSWVVTTMGGWESPAHFIVQPLASTYSIGSSGLKGRDLCPMRNCLNGQTETEISESAGRKLLLCFPSSFEAGGQLGQGVNPEVSF